MNFKILPECIRREEGVTILEIFYNLFSASAKMTTRQQSQHTFLHAAMVTLLITEPPLALYALQTTEAQTMEAQALSQDLLY